jgi:hypothetical protein
MPTSADIVAVPTSVILPRENDQQFSAAVRAASIASDYLIDSQEMYELGAEELKEFKRIEEDLDARRRSITDPINQGLRNANALFNPVIQRVQEASRILRGRMVEWSNKERARIAAENAERERQAREERQRMEAAARAAADAGREEEAFAMQQTAQLMTAPARATTAPKVGGVSTRSNWKAECVDLAQLVAWVVEHPDNLNMLQANPAALTAMAKAQKDKMKVPGVRTWNDAGMTVRTR